VAESVYYSLKPTKATSDEVYLQAVAQASELMQGFRGAVGESVTDEVLTLKDVEIWPASGGDGLEVPVVRVPIQAVDGWWTGPGKRLRAGGGGFFVGVVAPIPE
jgi:hypothetical protein